MREPKSGAEIDALLEGEQFSYQKVELPHGKSVGRRDRSSTARAILPDDLTGKTVLDVGCNYGYFCFEAKKRGAARVLGIDIDADALRRARLLADCLDVDAEFQLHDIEKNSLEESFDYVLCLNVLHHLRNPLSLLDHLIEITNDRLVLEVATLGPHDARNLRLPFLARAFLNRFPIIYVPPAEIKPHRQVKNYYMTPKAIEHLLIWQRRVFASVQTFPSDYKERFIAVAEKRKIRHLLVLAGPTSSGKRTIARKLAAGEIPQLAEVLGVTSAPSSFGQPMQDKDFLKPSPPIVERMIARYDLLRSRFTHVHGLEHNSVLDILNTGERLTFVTIFVPPETLRAQLLEADKGKLSSWHERHYAHYGDPAGLEEDYLRWFAHTDRYAGDHFVILPHDNMRLVPVKEFRQELPRLLGLASAPAK